MAAPDFPFVALHDLDLHGVRAFAKGDGIAADNAGLDEWVEGEDYAAKDTEAAEEAVTGPQRPAASASKAAWVDYAVALHDDGNVFGLTADEAQARTRDEIIEHIDGQVG